ncbi:MAG: hypothetical protein K0R50_79 [Eubacterium sp.]|nr:hypothetical protein [Eubacterium sp.]
MKKLIVILFLLLFLLVVTNPNQSDYNSWVSENLAEKLNYNSEGALGKALSPLSDVVVNSVTDRHNYFIFSIYETNLGSTEFTKTLGICKFFISLNSK